MALTARDNSGGDSIGVGYGITIWDGDKLVDSLYYEDGEKPNVFRVSRFLRKYNPETVEDTAMEEFKTVQDYIRDLYSFYLT